MANTYKTQMDSVVNWARLQWFINAIQSLQHPFGIIAEAENGKTQAVFGKNMGVFFEVDSMVIDNSYFINYIKNKVELFDNGTIKFEYDGEIHHINIKHWDTFLNIIVKEEE